MAVKLIKPVQRQMLSTEQQGKYKHRNIIVALLPGDEISFRIKGTKQVFTTHLGHCYRLAQMETAEREYSKKVETFKYKKALGKRAKKPKRTQFPFNKIYYKAIS